MGSNVNVLQVRLRQHKHGGNHDDCVFATILFMPRVGYSIAITGIQCYGCSAAEQYRF